MYGMPQGFREPPPLKRWMAGGLSTTTNTAPRGGHSLSFAELLRDYMVGKTIDEVVAGCTKLGVKINPTTMSQMRTGSRPAPKDTAVTRALAQVCGRDSAPILFAAELEVNPTGILTLIMGVLERYGGGKSPQTMEELLDRLAGLPASKTVQVEVRVDGKVVSTREHLIQDTTQASP
jgi:hypothetical protein